MSKQKKIQSNVKRRRGGTQTEKANKIQKFLKQYVLFKNFSLNERIKYFNYVQKYLKSMDDNSCLTPKIFEDDAQLNDGYTIQNVIDFEKQMGSRSNYGVIYRTSVKDMLGRFPIASKLYQLNEDNLKEVQLNQVVSNNFVKNKLSRHFLLSYKSFICNSGDYNVPAVIKNKRYIISLNELAAGDLFALIRSSRTFYRKYDLMLNIILQCLLSIATFHKAGWIHQDCHPGNFLYQTNTDTAGYYHYLILGKHYYLKNCGYTMMIYDFGLAEPIKTMNTKRPKYYDHYDKKFSTSTNAPFFYDHYDYKIMLSTFNTKSFIRELPQNIADFVTSIISVTDMPNKFQNENDLLHSLCHLFTNQNPIPNIFVDALPPGEKIINVKPYIIDDTLETFVPFIDTQFPNSKPSESPKRPSQSPKRPSQSLPVVSPLSSKSPKMPSQSPKMPSQSPKMPSQSPKRPSQSPKMPSQSPKRSLQSLPVVSPISFNNTPISSTSSKKVSPQLLSGISRSPSKSPKRPSQSLPDVSPLSFNTAPISSTSSRKASPRRSL
jgi:hypothetical protein